MATLFLEDVLLAGPSIAGLVGACAVHLCLWMVISNWEWGLMKHYWDFIKSRYPKLYHETIGPNHSGDVGLEVFGLSLDPAVLWIYNCLTALHHGTAGTLMLAGMYFESPALWRHGLLTQLAGMDVADFIKILWCRLAPPGPFPTSAALGKNSNGSYVAFISFHHSVSLLAGLPVCFYFSHDPRFQWMGALMAGGPMCFVAWDVFARCVAPQKRIFHLLSECYINSAFFYQRVILFFPLALSLLQIVYEAEVPSTAKLSLFLGGLSMSLFNLVCIGLMIYQCGNKLKKFTTEASVDSSKEKVDALETQASDDAKSSGSCLSSDDSTPLPTMLTSSASLTSKKLR